jgi:hypothetical protein
MRRSSKFVAHGTTSVVYRGPSSLSQHLKMVAEDKWISLHHGISCLSLRLILVAGMAPTILLSTKH